MQESVNYDELMELLGQLNETIISESNAIWQDCGSVSIKLNEIGFQGLATGTIDSAFSAMHNYYGRAHNYVTELINWVNTNVIKEYQSADEGINGRFNNALNGFSSYEQTIGGYGAPSIKGPGEELTSQELDWTTKLYNYHP